MCKKGAMRKEGAQRWRCKEMGVQEANVCEWKAQESEQEGRKGS